MPNSMQNWVTSETFFPANHLASLTDETKHRKQKQMCINKRGETITQRDIKKLKQGLVMLYNAQPAEMDRAYKQAALYLSSILKYMTERWPNIAATGRRR